jgi:hypothetical protein
MWTGNSWRKRRRDAIKDIRQLFGLTHAHTYVRDQYLKKKKKKVTTKMWRHLRLLYTLVGYLVKTQRNSNLCVFFLGRERLREISLLISLIIHTAQRCTINSNIIPSQNQIFTKKKMYLFYFHEEITRRGNGGLETEEFELVVMPA